MNAYRTTSIPKLTANEKKLVAQMTAGNLASFKAGRTCEDTDATTFKLADARPIKLATNSPCVLPPSSSGGTAGAWIVVALMLALIIGVPLFCALFGNPPICRGWNGPQGVLQLACRAAEREQGHCFVLLCVVALP